MSQRYALVIGNGRSGTNWLLSMLDASPYTHCRNEPQEITGSPFHRLPVAQHLPEQTVDMAKAWDYFALWTGKHMGERDHRIKAPKTHVYPVSQYLGLAYWPVRPKIRSVFQYLVPPLQQGEWPMPWWIGSQKELEKSYAIFKINDLRAWYVRWLLKERPQVPIVHLARHPGGQLNSGIKRFFSYLNQRELKQEKELYSSLLKTIIELEPYWQERFGDIDNMDLMEAVAWFWRYNNEEIYKAGINQENYMFMTYENLTKEPLNYARHIYEFLDIPWTNGTEKNIAKGLSVSVWGKITGQPNDVARAWTSNLDERYQRLVDLVLQDSILKDYWATL